MPTRRSLAHLTWLALALPACASNASPKTPGHVGDGLPLAQIAWEPGPLPVIPSASTRTRLSDDDGDDDAAPKRGGRRGRVFGRARVALSGTAPTEGATTTRMVIEGERLGRDPQVVAGDRFVVVHTASRYQIYDKATGRPVAAEVGDEITPSGDFDTLFSPLWAPRDRRGGVNRANVNLRLGFGSGDPVACDPESPTGSRACVQEFYDTRIVWDPLRKRFWIEAAARNHLWTCNPSARNPCTQDMYSRTQARRYLAVAVSRTDDPRKGFHRYILADDYADWPKMAVNERYLILGYRKSRNVYVFDADKLAAGNPGGGRVQVAKIDARFFKGAKYIAPVNHNDPSNGVTWLAGTDDGNRFIPIGLVNPDPSKAEPPIVAVGPAIDVGTKIRSLSTNPVFVGGKIHLVWDSCALKPDRSCEAFGRIHALRVPVQLTSDKVVASKDPAAGYLKLDFGLRDAGDAPADVIDYAMPAMDVNQLGDMVIVYSRRGVESAREIPPEVRYSIVYAGEQAPRPSVLVRAGSFDELPEVDDNVRAGLDFASASLDPSDRTTVWVSHGYGDKSIGWYKQITAAVKPR